MRKISKFVKRPPNAAVLNDVVSAAIKMSAAPAPPEIVAVEPVVETVVTVSAPAPPVNEVTEAIKVTATPPAVMPDASIVVKLPSVIAPNVTVLPAPAKVICFTEVPIAPVVRLEAALIVIVEVAAPGAVRAPITLRPVASVEVIKPFVELILNDVAPAAVMATAPVPTVPPVIFNTGDVAAAA